MGKRVRRARARLAIWVAAICCSRCTGSILPGPYDAAIVIGDHDGDRLSGWWMDSFGAGYSAAGKGEVTGALMLDRLCLSRGRLGANRLAPEGQGAALDDRRTRKPDGREKHFATYRLTTGHAAIRSSPSTGMTRGPRRLSISDEPRGRHPAVRRAPSRRWRASPMPRIAG